MPARKTADIEVIVTVSDAHVRKLPDVAAALRACGMKVSQTMASSGLIAGSAPRQALDRLRGVEGVAAVEASGEMHVAPPDSDIQ